MSLPELIMLAVVLLVGLPAATRNPTAAAMVAAWAFINVVWAVTGESLPLRAFVMADIAVLAVIALKPERCNYAPYRGAWHQLRCMVIERSPWDRIIISIFPVMWLLYVLNIPAFEKWWALWILAVVQFLAAGGEVLQSWRSAKRRIEVPDLPDTPSLYLAAIPVACLPEMPGIPSPGTEYRSAGRRGSYG